MNKLRILLSVAIVSFSLSANAQSFTIDTEKSEINWDAKHVSGSGHVGKIDIKEGSFKIIDNKIKSAIIVIDMNTLVNTDGEDGKPSERMVGHLKAKDFFDVEQFPTAEFKLTGSGKFVDGEAKIYGRLTIKGITKPINFMAKRKGNKFSAKVKIDRTDFGIRSRSGKFFPDLGDKAIKDEFDLNINLVLKQS